MPHSALGQKPIALLLALAALLLAAIIGVLVWQGSGSGSAQKAGGSIEAGMTDGAQPPAGMGGAEVPQVEFDPATAPVVPEGQSAADYVRAYYEACAAKDYATAFDLLPVASQQYYGDVAAFEETLEAYGVTDYEIGQEVDTGDTVSVVGGQAAQGMWFNYEWLFVKGEDGTLHLKSRTMAQ